VAVGDQPSLSVSTSFTLKQQPEEIAVAVDAGDLSSIASELVEGRNGKQRFNTTMIKDELFVVNYTV
jgi:hypothetical protein